eukprot:scpid41557/ scgid16168/ 
MMCLLIMVGVVDSQYTNTFPILSSTLISLVKTHKLSLASDTRHEGPVSGRELASAALTLCVYASSLFITVYPCSSSVVHHFLLTVRHRSFFTVLLPYRYAAALNVT